MRHPLLIGLILLYACAEIPEPCAGGALCSDTFTDECVCICQEGLASPDPSVVACRPADNITCVSGLTEPRPCGVNQRGVETRTCADGRWTAYSQCRDPDACVDGTFDRITCGLNLRGTESRTCVDGQWSDVGPCEDQDACIDGSTDTRSCSAATQNTEELLCVDGQWRSFGGCDGDGPCIDGAISTQPCGLNLRGTTVRTCDDGQWSDFGSCADTDTCIDDVTDTRGCGSSGQGIEDILCVSGQWRSVGVCRGDAECISGETGSRPCGLRGTEPLFCSEGTWVPTSDCVEPDICQDTVGVPCPQFEEAYIKSDAPRAFDNFGVSVALESDTLVIGRDLNQGGAAYIFTRAADGWFHQDVLTPPQPESLGMYGHTVALSGDRLAVGAINENNRNGTTYVYARSDSGWGLTGQLSPRAQNFGIALALDNDTLAVGTLDGAVYIYVGGSQSTWILQSQLDGAPGFGTTLALDGDTLAIGSTGENESGMVHIYTRNGQKWTRHTELSASNASAHIGFGSALALRDQTLAVGAPTEGNSGAVYVYELHASVWSQQAYLKASNADLGDRFGRSLALNDSVLLVGATDEDGAARGINGDQTSDQMDSSGAIYLFRRMGQAWLQTAYIKASNTNLGDAFGSAVDMDSSTFVVGAYGEDSSAAGIDGDQDSNQLLESGAVYIRRLEATPDSR